MKDTNKAVQYSDSYDNTDELTKKFPVMNPTPIETPMACRIQNRLLNGFENWNRGYDAWKAWGDILYTKDSLYNVHGAHMTLQEYQAAMDVLLKQIDNKLGRFHNMLIVDDWCAIHYDISSTVRATGACTYGNVMEFVNFRDYGGKLGTRVVEGWASSKDNAYPAMAAFTTEKEKAEENEVNQKVIHAIIPDTNDLVKKYPVVHPTTVNSEKIRDAVLSETENWNKGLSFWKNYMEEASDSGYVMHDAFHGKMSLKEYENFMEELEKKEKTTRVFFDNMIISGDYAAIHYRTRKEDTKTHEMRAQDVMQFIHYKDEENGMKILESWVS